MKIIGLLFTAALLLSSCGNNGTHQNEMAPKLISDQGVMRSEADYGAISARAVTYNDDQTIAQGSDLAGVGAKVIYTGSIALLSDNLEESRSRVDTLVAGYNGYYSNESFNDFDHESVYALTIRIPAVSFESFVNGVESIGDRVINKNVYSRDVTEEYIDLEMRLSNRRSYLGRYNELLVQARSVADILEIQEKTRRLEEEIESVEGRLRYLSGQVDYSTVFLTITKKKEFRFRPERRDSFIELLKQSLFSGWRGLISFMLFLVRIWPLWITALALFLFFRKRYC